MSSSQTAAADRLWQRFGEMFGARFFESFGPKPSESWTDAVKELRHDQVRAAIGKIRNSGAAHPPSLPEFVALAKNVKPQEFNRPADKPVGDDYVLLGNRWLLAFLLRTGGVPEDAIPWLVELKNRIVEDYRSSGDTCGGETTADWLDVAMQAFDACANKRLAAQKSGAT